MQHLKKHLEPHPRRGTVAVLAAVLMVSLVGMLAFAIDLSYLTDACVQMALEQGSEAIVQRVFDGFRSPRKPL